MKFGKEIYTNVNWLHIIIICLSIFILGVQLGIKHGRTLQLEDMGLKYGYEFTN